MSGDKPEIETSVAKAAACPICGRPRMAEFRPFCSARCQDVDLARWFTGVYSIAGEPSDPDAAESVEAGEQGARSGRKERRADDLRPNRKSSGLLGGDPEED